LCCYSFFVNLDQKTNATRFFYLSFFTVFLIKKSPYNGTQALYIFKRGGGDNIWRIRYTGSLNKPPIAVITVNQTTFDVGQMISFDGSRSSDVDDTNLTYKWDFGNGDISDRHSPNYVYNKPGQYTVRLSVTDPSGQKQEDSQLIKIGTPPTLSITTPPEGKRFVVGESMTLSGVAYNSSGGRLDDMSISWEVRKHVSIFCHRVNKGRMGEKVLMLY
jgi:PKD repeat protein